MSSFVWLISWIWNVLWMHSQYQQSADLDGCTFQQDICLSSAFLNTAHAGILEVMWVMFLWTTLIYDWNVPISRQIPEIKLDNWGRQGGCRTVAYSSLFHFTQLLIVINSILHENMCNKAQWSCFGRIVGGGGSNLVIQKYGEQCLTVFRPAVSPLQIIPTALNDISSRG